VGETAVFGGIKVKFFFVFAGIALAMLSQLSCSTDEEQTQPGNPIVSDTMTGLNAAPLLGDVVLENMYADEARKLTDKTPVQIVTVLEGTSRVVLHARFRGVRDSGLGFPLYECELMDESAEALGGIAAGMSGSPVGPPGRIMGALAYGDSFARAPTRFLVTAIDAMEASIEHATFGELLEQAPAPAAPGGGIRATYAPVKTPMMITGIQAHRIEELSSHLTGSKFNFVEFFANIGGAPAAPPAGATTKLAAGDMIGAAIATGDVVNAIGFGTVTQVYDNTFVAFGHPLFSDGKAALPVYRAVVNGIVPSLERPYKSVSAYGNPIGTITKDLTPAIVGELGAPPPMIPVKVSYHPVNSNAAIEKHHVVAYGQEWYIPLVAAATMEAIRMEQNAATVEGVVTLRFQETDTVYTETFRRASSVPFLDVLTNTESIIQSFMDTLTNNAGKATLKEVSISIMDKPQIAKAEIDEIIVPDEVMPGESIPISVVLLPHWTTAGAERTIQREVLLDIPENFPAGEAYLVVSASARDFPGFPGEIIEFGFGGPDEEEERPLPKNLNELIEQKKEDQVDAGLITITLTPPNFGGGFPPPEDFPLPENGEMPEDGEEEGEEGENDKGDGEMPEDLPFPEGFPLPEESEPPPPVEAELILEGFIVTGFKEVTVTIKGEEGEEAMGPVEAMEALKE